MVEAQGASSSTNAELSADDSLPGEGLVASISPSQPGGFTSQLLMSRIPALSADDSSPSEGLVTSISQPFRLDPSRTYCRLPLRSFL
jgi:hypothetical protein